jgi:hypothetical protein
MEASDGYGYLFLIVFLGIVVIVGIAVIAVFAPQYTGLALLGVAILTFLIFAVAYSLGGERT